MKNFIILFILIIAIMCSVKLIIRLSRVLARTISINESGETMTSREEPK